MTELSEPNENDLKSFREKLQRKARPSNLSAEVMRHSEHDDSILGQVHLALAKYHEVCRFTDDGCYDREAARFHLRAAGIPVPYTQMKRLFTPLFYSHSRMWDCGCYCISCSNVLRTSA